MSRRKKQSSKSTRKVVAADVEPETTITDVTSAIDLQSLKTAIVCDWLTGTGGAERVVLEMHKMFPKAPIYTSQYDKNPRIWYGDTWFQDAEMHTTWLQRLPKKLKKFLPVLRARAFSQIDLSAYDLVVISSSAEAKAVKVGPSTKVVWYCHAPTHYYWSRYDSYLQHPGFGALDPLARFGLFALVRPLRRWDYAVAQKPEFVIANSTHTQNEIKKYYGRESTVVFPPVDLERFRITDVGADTEKPSPTKSSTKARITQPQERFGFVIAGRQTPYKRIDLAVDACSRLNLPLTVIGNGPEHTKLAANAGPSVRFLTNVSDAEMVRHFQRAAGFIFPGIDDFGIVAVEALSAGTPVIAYRAGGAIDYVTESVTGSFFNDQTVDSLVETLQAFKPQEYDSQKIVAEAEKYAANKFSARMTEAIQTFLQKEDENDSRSDLQND